MSKLLGIVDKNSRERIEVRAAEYNGHEYVDICTYWKGKDDDPWRPSKKGVTLKPELVGELIGLLRKAESGGTLASGEPWKLEPTMILPNECRGALYQTLVPRARPQHIVSDTVRLDF